MNMVTKKVHMVTLMPTGFIVKLIILPMIMVSVPPWAPMNLELHQLIQRMLKWMSKKHHQHQCHPHIQLNTKVTHRHHRHHHLQHPFIPLQPICHLHMHQVTVTNPIHHTWSLHRTMMTTDNLMNLTAIESKSRRKCRSAYHADISTYTLAPVYWYSIRVNYLNYKTISMKLSLQSKQNADYL